LRLRGAINKTAGPGMSEVRWPDKVGEVGKLRRRLGSELER
jgi:hypothetical protein